MAYDRDCRGCLYMSVDRRVKDLQVSHNYPTGPPKMEIIQNYSNSTSHGILSLILLIKAIMPFPFDLPDEEDAPENLHLLLYFQHSYFNLNLKKTRKNQ